MTRTYIVVSTFVDELLKDAQPDIEFHIFKSLYELSTYIDSNPLRAEKLYATEEVFAPAYSRAFNFLWSMLERKTLQVDSVEYITEEGAEGLPSIQYLKEHMELENVNIVMGSLTRDYVSSYITGTLKRDSMNPRRKAIIRVKTANYVDERTRNRESMNEDYPSEEELLSGIPPEEVPRLPILSSKEECNIINVTGIKCKERMLFSFMVAQYLALTNKTIIVEKDFEYLELTDMAARADIKFTQVPVADLFSNPQDVFRAIKLSPDKLIVISCDKRGDYTYQFICQLLYSNLHEYVDYIVKINEIEEISSSDIYTVVMPNNTVDILKTLDVIPITYNKDCKFVCIDTCKVKELSLKDSRQVSLVASDVLATQEILNVPILEITTLMLGGETHDLRSYIE